MQSEYTRFFNALIIGLLCMVMFSTSASAVNETGLVAYYSFDGDTKDNSGNGNDGTNNGAVFVSGKSGDALNFDGLDDHVNISININPDKMPQMTVTAWVKSNIDSEGTIISHDDGGYDRTLKVDHRGGGVGWSAFSGTSNVLGYHPVSTVNWTFVAVVYDQDSGAVKLYVDGTMYEEEGVMRTGLNYTHIGANPTYGKNFDGIIDEVKIYNRTLDQSELNSLLEGEIEVQIDQTEENMTPTSTTTTTSNAASSEQGLVAYYPFDGDIADYSGNGNNGTNYGATFVSGKMGEALEFNGTSDYVQVPVNLNPDVMPQATLIAWAKPDGELRTTVISHDNGGYDRTINIDQRGGGTGWSAFSGTEDVLGYHPVSVGNWTFLAAVYDQDAGTVKLYVDGNLYEEEGVMGAGWNYTIIGSNPSFGKYFDGCIDEVRIYSYAMNESEINYFLGESTETAYTSFSVVDEVTDDIDEAPIPVEETTDIVEETIDTVADVTDADEDAKDAGNENAAYLLAVAIFMSLLLVRKKK